MISLTAAEINAWVVAFFFPLARVLALLAPRRHSTTRPCPPRVRLMAGLAITIGIAPALPPMPASTRGREPACCSSRSRC
jgi:flagellar biosynthetic protein FliR